MDRRGVGKQWAFHLDSANITVRIIMFQREGEGGVRGSKRRDKAIGLGPSV